MSKFQYRISVETNTVVSNSPYTAETHDLEIVEGPKDEQHALIICQALGMRFLGICQDLFGFKFKAQCTKETSAFIWAGGKTA